MSLELAKSIRYLSIDSQRKIQEVVKNDGVSLFNPYEISLKEGGEVCIVSGLSLKDAALQINEVADRFGYFANELTIKEISYMKKVGGKPAYEHVYGCEEMAPQVVYEFSY